MASLRKVGGRWHIRWTEKGRPETVDSFDAEAWSKSDIKAHKRELEVLYEKGEYDPWRMDHPHDHGPEPTLGEALKEYIDEKTAAGRRGEAHGWTEATRRGKKTVLEDWASEVGEHRLLGDVRHADVRSYVYREDIALSTRKGYRTHLNAFLSWADEQGYPTPEKVKPIAESHPDPEYVSEKELYAICDAHCQLMERRREKKYGSAENAYKSAAMTEIFRLAFYQGLRRGEIVRLRAEDIDTEDWLLRISAEQKSKRPSVIPVTPPAKDVLRPFLRKSRNKTPLLGYRTGQYITEHFKDSVKKAISDRHRVERLRFHSLRHSCAVYWRRQGMTLADIRDLLRHQSVRTTEIYDKMVPDDLAGRFEDAYD